MVLAAAISSVTAATLGYDVGVMADAIVFIGNDMQLNAGVRTLEYWASTLLFDVDDAPMLPLSPELAIRAPDRHERRYRPDLRQSPF